MKNRLWAVDVLRVISVLMIFLFHTQMHIGCTYGIFNLFVSQGAIFMICFFKIAGYSLYYSYNDKNLMKKEEMKYFYIKKIASLYPLYIVIGILFELLNNTLSVKQIIRLIPIEISVLQSYVEGFSTYSHNGGTWFLSCLVLCTQTSHTIYSL